MKQRDHLASVFQNNNSDSSIYSFSLSATNTNINNLAKKIMATKTAGSNILNLKKYGNVSI